MGANMNLTAHRPVGADRPQLGRWKRTARGWEFSPTCGRGRLVGPDGETLWLGEWEHNALHDEGEQSMLNVYFREQTNPSKYLMLHNGADVTALADTVTLAGLTESETTGTDGYSRIQVLAADWGAPALDAGDYMTTAAEKTFGPNTGAGQWDVTHVCLATVATGTSGLLISSIPLSAEQSVVTDVAFKFTMRAKAA
jgi:hypothetical protein